jgi:hypothetical protein
MPSSALQIPAEVEVGQIWVDEDGKKWKVRAFSKRGWPVVTRFGYRTAQGIETNPRWFNHWTPLPDTHQPPQSSGGKG